MTKTIIASIAALCVSTPIFAEDSLVVQVPVLTMERAVIVAQGAIETCREKGIQIAVSVVDRNGTLQVTLRDTIASPITATISEMKAKTAVYFNAATSAMTERADTPIGRIDGLVMSAGGVPVRIGESTLVAGVGVSGAPSGKTDEECALGGIAKIQEDLDMAM